MAVEEKIRSGNKYLGMTPVQTALTAVADSYNDAHGGGAVPNANVLLVTFCYILGGWKASVITNHRDQRYYEVTFHVRANEIYVDTYEKVRNEKIIM
jgi:hypothetical protein